MTTICKVTSRRWCFLAAILLCLTGLPPVVFAAHFIQPTPSPAICDFMGTLTINGAPAQAGDEVAFFDPQGIVCGLYVVQNSGEYGVVHVYGDDSSTAGVDEGAIFGDILTVCLWDSAASTEWSGPDIELSAGSPFPGSSFEPSQTPPEWEDMKAFVLNINTRSYFGSPAGTPYVCAFIGNLSVLEAPAQLGDEVAVYDDDGILCGAVRVTTPGQYGVLSVYGDDPATPGVDEGADEGDILSFKVWDASENEERSPGMLAGTGLGSFIPSAVPPVFAIDAGYVLDMEVFPYNIGPTAEAGVDQNAIGGNTVNLDGSGSFDPDDYIDIWDWTLQGDSGVTLNDPDTATPWFTAPAGTLEGKVLTCTLTVTDSNGASDVDAMNVMVFLSNIPPVADSGTDQVVTGGQRVDMDGTGSHDDDGSIISYLWNQESGTTISFSDQNIASPWFTAPVGTYAGEVLSFTLTVTDNNSAFDQDEVNIIVYATDTNNPIADGWSYDPSCPGAPISMHLYDDQGIDSSSISMILNSSTITYTLVVTDTLIIDDAVITDVLVTYTPDMPWYPGSVVTATVFCKDVADNPVAGTSHAEFTVRDNTTHDVYAGESIQDALDCATWGDVVLVRGGVFTLTQRLDITQRHSGVSLMGQGVATSTILMDDGLDYAVVIDGAIDFWLEGLTLQSSTGATGLVGLWGETKNTLVTANRFQQTEDQFMKMLSAGASGSGNRIENNLFLDPFNSATGIDVFDGSPEIANNTLTGCRTGIYSKNAIPGIAYNLLADCTWGMGRQSGNPGLDVYYNLVWGSVEADYDGPITHTTDINVDPQFVGGGDYHLQTTSPAVDYIYGAITQTTGIALPTVDLDGVARPAGQKFDIGCYDTTAPFIFTSTPGSGVLEDQTYTYIPGVSGGTVVSYTWGAGSLHPIGAVISETTGKVIYTPTDNSHAGTYTIIIEAHDTDGRTAAQEFLLTVTAVNDLPQIPTPVTDAPYYGMGDRLFTFEFESTDEETGILTWSLAPGAPVDMSFQDSITGVLEYMAPNTENPEVITFTVKVSDGQNIVQSQAITATILPRLALSPPSGAAALIDNGGLTATVTIDCDIEGGLPPYWVGLTNPSAGEIQGLQAAGGFTFAPLKQGTTQLRITDTAGLEYTSGIFSVQEMESEILIQTPITAGEVFTQTVTAGDFSGMEFIGTISGTGPVSFTISVIVDGSPFMAEGPCPGVVDMGPDGAQLQSGARLTLPMGACLYRKGEPAQDLMAFTYNKGKSSWEYLPGQYVDGDDLVAPMDHFSLYTMTSPSQFPNDLLGGTQVENYSQISFPAYAANLDSIVDALGAPDNLNAYDDTKWRLFGFIPSDQWSDDPEQYYVEGSEAGFDAQFPFRPCQAYWIISRYAKQVEVPGLATNDSQDYYIMLEPGWNMLGNPFSQNLNWTLAESSVDGVTYYVQSDDNGDNPLKGENLFYYAPAKRKAAYDGYAETTIMASCAGYWVRNPFGAPISLKLPHTAIQVIKKGDIGMNDKWFAGITRKMSHMVQRAAWAATGTSRPPAPPGAGGSNPGSGPNSIGTVEGGGGGCFVESLKPSAGNARAELLGFMLLSILGLVVVKRRCGRT